MQTTQSRSHGPNPSLRSTYQFNHNSALCPHSQLRKRKRKKRRSLTRGKSDRSASIDSPQHSSLINATNFASFPWLRLSRMAAFNSPAVFIRCSGDSNSAIDSGTDGDDSNANNAIVRSNSDKNSGLFCPCGANSSCANRNASSIFPSRMYSISFCCCSRKNSPGLRSKICVST